MGFGGKANAGAADTTIITAMIAATVNNITMRLINATSF
jgi:hypothetical protein